MTTGAAGALVNLGGDVQVVGQAPTDDGWVIEIEDPLDPTRSITLIGVTVVAPTASWAEALTKAVLVAGDLTPIHHTTATAIAVRRDGTCLASPQLHELCP